VLSSGQLPLSTAGMIRPPAIASAAFPPGQVILPASIGNSQVGLPAALWHGLSRAGWAMSTSRKAGRW